MFADVALGKLAVGKFLGYQFTHGRKARSNVRIDVVDQWDGSVDIFAWHPTSVDVRGVT